MPSFPRYSELFYEKNRHGEAHLAAAPEDDEIIRTTMERANINPEDVGLEIVNTKQVKEKGGPLPSIQPPTKLLL